MADNRKAEALQHWNAVDQFIMAARTDIARGQYIKANAIGLVAASEYIQEHELIVENGLRNEP